jgi:16S rRNA (adenine1518-N6/adenine1519-N6)-dimethyltransferase
MIDLSNIDQLKKHLKRYGLWAEKSLGQHFLVDTEILDKIVEAAELTSSDRVLEVGAGPGVLSQRLAPHVKELMSLEIDRVMIVPWRDLMKDYPHAQIIAEDVLKYIPEDIPYKLVANIPYYITSPILKHFLRHQGVRRPSLIVLLMQREVAERIVDLKHPTLLSWELRVFGDARIISTVSPKSFYPAPKVESAILQLKLYDEPSIKGVEMEAFFELLSIAYRQPRKTLLNNFCASGKWDKEQSMDFFTKSGVEATLRPHQLSLDKWKLLLRQTLDAESPKSAEFLTLDASVEVIR